MSDSNGERPPSASTRPHIPQTLRKIPRWIPWREELNPGGKPTKKPQGSTRRGANFKAWDKVALRKMSRTEGLGFVLSGGVTRKKDGAKLLAFDIDACRCPRTGKIKPWATTHMLLFRRSYSEVTPSGTGLRQWVWCINPPEAMPIIKVPEPAPDGVNKTPEIQTFGCGPAGYVTVTGDKIDGTTAEPLTFNRLDELLDAWDIKPADLTAAAEALPEGGGERPSIEEVKERVLAVPNGEAMVAADWESFDLPSASELWYRLVKHALRAANHYGDVAVEFLCDETAFGSGDVDSKEPDRYARPEWVMRDVARVAGKAGEDGDSALDDAFDATTWEIPERYLKGRKAAAVEREAEKDGGRDPDEPWIMSAGAHRKTLSKQRFLVYHLLPHRGVSQFFGEPSCGKTPFAISLALHVGLGRETWFGRDIEHAGKVVYMIGEDATGVSDRLFAQLKTMAPGGDLDASGVHVSTRPGRLCDPKNAVAWAKKIAAQLGSISLFVIDTQNANFGPGNENSTEDMTAFLVALGYISRKLGCLVLLVHHTGHSEKGRARGSSVSKGAIDAEFQITKTEMTVTATSRKSKNWAMPEPLIGELIPVVIDIDEKGRDVTAITLDDTPAVPADVFDSMDQDMELEQLLQFFRDANGHPLSLGDIETGTGLTRKVIRNRIARAFDLGILIVQVNGNKPSTYRVIGKPLSEAEELLS